MKNFINEYNERINQLLISQLFFYTIEIELYTKLETVHDYVQLAKSLAIEENSFKEILDILVDLDYIEVTNDLYYNTKQSSNFLAKQSDDYIGQLLLDKLNLVSLENISNFTKIKTNNKIKLTNTIDFKQLALSKEKEIRIFRSGYFDDKINQLFNNNDKINMLDLGCGNGILSLTTLANHPSFNLTLFDQEYVLDVAKDNVDKYQVSNQVSFIAGDFMIDDINKGYDLVIASGILDFAEDKLNDLLNKIYSSLNDNGYLFVYSVSFTTTRENAAKARLQWLSSTIKSKAVGEKTDINGIIIENGFKLVEQSFDGLYPLNIYRK